MVSNVHVDPLPDLQADLILAVGALNHMEEPDRVLSRLLIRALSRMAVGFDCWLDEHLPAFLKNLSWNLVARASFPPADRGEE